MKRVVAKSLIKTFHEKHRLFENFGITIDDHLQLHRFEKNEYICREGEKVNYLYFMVSGRAKVTTVQENGKTMLLCFYNGFGVIGDLELFTEAAYTTSMQALSLVHCLAIDLRALKRTYLSEPVFLKNMSRELAAKLLKSSRSATFNLLYPLEERLATYIYLTNTQGVFKERLTSLSELLASSYRHLSRVLKSFCRQNILVKKRDGYHIIDENKLKLISNKYINSF